MDNCPNVAGTGNEITLTDLVRRNLSTRFYRIRAVIGKRRRAKEPEESIYHQKAQESQPKGFGLSRERTGLVRLGGAIARFILSILRLFAAIPIAF